MNIFLKLTILLFVFVPYCFAMDIIAFEHSERHKKFTINRQDGKIFDHTQSIYGVLSDESRISKRHATDAERKTIFQSIMATRIIDGGIEENRQKVIGNYDHTITEQSLSSHFLIIKKVDLLSRNLVKSFKEWGFEHLQTVMRCNYFKFGIDPGLDELTGVSSDTFMDWFYESLEQHYDELSFFGGAKVGASSASGKIDRKWFETIQKQFSAQKVSTQSLKDGEIQHTWILNTQGKPEAVYKPRLVGQKKNSHSSDKPKERNVVGETFSGLFAKVMGLDDVVNRTIPVRVQGDQLIFDPCKPTGTIELLIGFSESQISSDSDDFSNLIRHVCKFYKDKADKEKNINSNSIIQISHAKNDTYNILTQGTLKYMFAAEGEYKSEDVRVIADARTIRSIDLFKIIMFWHLSSYFDMHASNIIFVPDFRNKTLKPMVIDCEYTWGHEALYPQHPEIYQLHQAKTPVSSEEMMAFFDVPQNKLLNIFKAFCASVARQKDSLLTRLNTLKSYCTEDRTIGKLMNLILKPNPIFRSITTYTGTLDHYIPKEEKLYTDTKEEIDSSNLYQVPYSIVGCNFLPGLDWIFSIFDEKCLDGSIRINSVKTHANLKHEERIRSLLGGKHLI